MSDSNEKIDIKKAYKMPYRYNLSDQLFIHNEKDDKTKELTREEYLKQLEEKIALLERKKELTDGLPHLFGKPHYLWSRQFFESTKRWNFLCAGNQIGKSSTMIRKAIHWCTAKELWPRIWKSEPLQFWYLYPSKEVATIEFQKKWLPEWLPRGKFMDHPQYGFKIERRNSLVNAVHFNTGVSIYFKAYHQDSAVLQSGTCHAIFADEELPCDLLEELKFRLAAVEGVFHLAFTATLAQEYWREVLEEGRHFKDMLRMQVSLYDCLNYEDGSKSHWSVERIQELEESCRTENEKLKRIYGKFVKDEGLMISGFDKSINVMYPIEIPKDWLRYCGIDIGSGGATGHPSAIVFIAINPNFKEAVVYKGWIGHGIQTTSGDVFQKYIELRATDKMAATYYDFGAADFGTIALRNREPVLRAHKGRNTSINLINNLFKFKMLRIFDTDQLKPLVRELLSLDEKNTINKTHAKDDFTDALLYGISALPWNFEGLKVDFAKINPVPRILSINERRMGIEDKKEGLITYDQLINEWNDIYGE